ncbi:MAG: NAD-dependent epimerase/dehydratase family protein, partial [Flavobacteriia bacterium]|nr:NAD-dependent epimerase/dehydratase family protein [Flavobacteriia bacterium]
MEKVLLTGISGFVGQHCAAELLKAGYSVRGSLRDSSKGDAIRKAFEVGGIPTEELTFCVLDLLKDEGWEEAMKDCSYMLHVASPYQTREPKDQDEYIRPAVEGTMRALKAAQNAGVKKVVVTSSLVAMLGDADRSLAIAPTTWTNPGSRHASAYLKSKVLAEKSAWAYIKGLKEENAMQLTTIHPGPIFGPTYTGEMSGASLSMTKDLITGRMPMLPKAAINMSDVRDVAQIHVQALKNDQVSGKRLIVATERPYKFIELAQILKSNGYKKVSTKEAPIGLMKFMGLFVADIKGMLPFVGKTYSASIEETMQLLGWTPRSIEKTITDTA